MYSREIPDNWRELTEDEKNAWVSEFLKDLAASEDDDEPSDL